MMTVTEMIKKYKLALDYDKRGKPTGKICCWDVPNGNELTEIKSRKSEILVELMAEYEANVRAYEMKKAKIDAIEGLREMRANKEAQLRYRYEFNCCMEDEATSSFPPVQPEDRSAELAEKYPRAAAYLKAERNANSANYEISAIGSRAMEKILSGEDYDKVIAEMNKELEEFVSRHMFD